jgi:hypothetical protein
MRGTGRAMFAAILLLIAGTLNIVYPWWPLAIFFLSVWVVYGIVVLGEDERELVT